MAYLIKDTTKEQRRKIVKDGIALCALDAPVPSIRAMELYSRYIDGEMELDEIKTELIRSYAKI